MPQYKEGQTATNPQTGQRVIFQGNQWVPYNAPAAPPKLTEQQAKTGLSAARMGGAAKTLAPLESQIDPTWNFLTSPLGNGQARSYEAAENEWIDSLLRATTGASFTKQEIDMARKTYFPVFGDNEDIRRQKAEARRRVEQDLYKSSGPAEGVFNPPPAPPAPRSDQGFSRKAKGPPRKSPTGASGGNLKAKYGLE